MDPIFLICLGRGGKERQSRYTFQWETAGLGVVTHGKGWAARARLAGGCLRDVLLPLVTGPELAMCTGEPQGPFEAGSKYPVKAGSKAFGVDLMLRVSTQR